MAVIPRKQWGSWIVERICGPSRLFTLDRQIVHWITFCVFLMGVVFVATNALFNGGLFWSLFSMFSSFGIYLLARLRVYPHKQIVLLSMVCYLIIATGTWLAHAGIEGIMPALFIVPLVAALTILHGYTRIIMLVAIPLHIALLTYVQLRYPTWITFHQDEVAHQVHLLVGYYLIVLFCIGFVAVFMHNLKTRQRQTEQVLDNILPASVAATLKDNPERNIAHYFENVSILFADIVNFTPMAAEMSPVELVTLLNELFSDFDALVSAYGVEKIKTIGDSYMVAAGAPRARIDHAQILIQIALEMQQITRQKQYQGRTVQLRIGINSGSVVAGVIGQGRSTYDLWGETVILASQMESYSRSGVIQITRSTYELVHQDFHCTAQGLVEISDRGAIEIWHVINARSALANILSRTGPKNLLTRSLKRPLRVGGD